jgi:hypothetical protein
MLRDFGRKCFVENAGDRRAAHSGQEWTTRIVRGHSSARRYRIACRAAHKVGSRSALSS